jgi:hypothetical protein
MQQKSRHADPAKSLDLTADFNVSLNMAAIRFISKT